MCTSPPDPPQRPGDPRTSANRSFCLFGDLWGLPKLLTRPNSALRVPGARRTDAVRHGGRRLGRDQADVCCPRGTRQGPRLRDSAKPGGQGSRGVCPRHPTRDGASAARGDCTLSSLRLAPARAVRPLRARSEQRVHGEVDGRRFAYTWMGVPSWPISTAATS